MFLTTKLLIKVLAYCLSEKADIGLISDIGQLLPYIKRKVSDLKAKSIVDLLDIVIQKRLSDIPPETILVSIIPDNKKEEIIQEILDEAINTDIDEDFTQTIKQLIRSIKLNEFLKILNDTISDIKLNEIDIEKAYQKLKKSCESVLMQITLTTTDDISQLLLDIRLNPSTLENIFVKLQELKQSFFYTVDTGFPSLNKYLMGYQPGRVYIVAAPPGRGKSMFLLNAVYYASKSFLHQVKPKFEQQFQNVKPYVLYITNENTTVETLARFVGIIRQCTIPVDELYKEENKKALEAFLQQTQCEIEFKYVTPHQTTVTDIISIIESTYAHRKALPFFVVVDYLDRLQSSFHKNRDLRIELGQIVDELKHLSIKYNIPVLTATQLNRESLKDGVKVDLTHISESWKKVENADVVMLLQHDKEENRKLNLHIAKLRYNQMPENPIQLNILDGFLLSENIFTKEISTEEKTNSSMQFETYTTDDFNLDFGF